MSSNRVEIIFGSDHAGYELKNRLCNFYALSSHPLVSRDLMQVVLVMKE